MVLRHYFEGMGGGAQEAKVWVITYLEFNARPSSNIDLMDTW